MNNVFEKKMPITMEQYVTVEIECFSVVTRHTLGTALSKWAKWVHLKDDGSIESDFGNTYEIVVTTPIDKFEEVLKGVLATVHKYRSGVNDTCGLHVHLDMRRYSRKYVAKVYANLVRSQGLLFKIVSKDRRYNDYCYWNEVDEFEYGADRYSAINPQAYGKFTTLEVRLHQGSLNFKQIYNWVTLLHKIAFAETPDKFEWPKTTKSFYKTYHIKEPALKRYVSSRMKAA